jgi:hypothetical protein
MGRGTKQKNADQPHRPAYPLRHGENSVSEEVCLPVLDKDKRVRIARIDPV